MTELKDKCSQFLGKRVAELKPTDSALMDLLVVASDHDMKALLGAIIPKVINLPLSDLEKYFDRIKPSVVILLQKLMLLKYAPRSVTVGSANILHNLVSILIDACSYCGFASVSQCITCGHILCNGCIPTRLCSAAPPKPCNFCKKSGTCECGSEELKKIMNM